VIVTLVRLVTFFVALSALRLSARECLLIAWFGPRGLSSLLLILVPVFAGAPGSEQLFQIACFVVLFSVMLHGGSLMFLGRGQGPRTLRPAAPENIPERAGAAAAPQMQPSEATAER